MHALKTRAVFDTIISTKENISREEKMIHYQSTRGSKYIKTSAQAIIAGIAEDKGLYVPSEIPALPFEIDDMVGKPYKEVAYRIIKAFIEAVS